MKNYLVSILVPIYNVEKYIEKCAISLFEQSYDNIEYIFVDDCSPDKSVEIIQTTLRKYPNRELQTKLIKHKFNEGLAVARNTGLQNATGDYVLFVDSDDYIDKQTVEALVYTAQSNKSDIVVYDMKYLYPDKTVFGDQNIENNTLNFVKQLLLYKVDVCVCGKLFKRSLFVDNNISFIDDLNFGEDYATSSRVAFFANCIAHCKGIYYNYIQYNSSSYTRAYKSKNIDDLLKAIKILSDFFHVHNTDIYSDTIKRAQLMVKVRLLIAIALHYETVGHRLKEVAFLYKELPDKYKDDFSVEHKIVLWLAEHEFFILLRLLIVSGFRFKQMIKRYL